MNIELLNESHALLGGRARENSRTRDTLVGTQIMDFQDPPSRHARDNPGAMEDFENCLELAEGY